MILYFSSFSVYPSRKCIYRRFAVSPSRAAQVPHMLGFPFLIPVCFWKSKTLHYISRKEETTWGNKTRLEKITCHSKRGHNCWTIYMPCAGNFSWKPLTRAMIWKQPNSLSAQVMGGVLSRQQMVCTGGLPWESLLPATGSTLLSALVILLRCISFLQIQYPHLRSHQPLSESFPTHFSSISTIASESQLLVYVA